MKGIFKIPKLLRKDLKDQKVQTILLQTVYPEIVAYLKNKLNKEGTIQILRNMGKNVAKTISKEWIPKGKNLKEMAREVFEFIFDNKSIKFKKDEEGNLLVIDPECRLCTEGLEVSEINYCEIISSALEGFVNIVRETYVYFPKASITTVSSKASGAKNCIHVIKIL